MKNFEEKNAPDGIMDDFRQNDGGDQSCPSYQRLHKPKCMCAKEYAVFIESGETWRRTFPVRLKETEDRSPHIRLEESENIMLDEGGYMVTFFAWVKLNEPATCQMFALLDKDFTDFTVVSQPQNSTNLYFHLSFYVRSGEKGGCLNLIFQHSAEPVDAKIQVVVEKLS